MVKPFPFKFCTLIPTLSQYVKINFGALTTFWGKKQTFIGNNYNINMSNQLSKVALVTLLSDASFHLAK